MDIVEKVAFDLISNVGTAKSLIMEAIIESREGDIEKARALMEESEQYILNGHKSHFDVIQKEADGEKVEISLILMHAEDQMITTMMLKDIANELINMNEKYRNK